MTADWGARWSRTAGGRMRVDAFVLKIPLAGSLVVQLSVAQATRSLATLLAGGITLVESWEIAAESITNRELRRRIRELTQYRLTPNHNNVLIIGDHARRPNNMFQLRTRHKSPTAPLRSKLQQTGSPAASPACTRCLVPTVPASLPQAPSISPPTHPNSVPNGLRSLATAANCPARSPPTPAIDATSPQLPDALPDSARQSAHAPFLDCNATKLY